jgi:hypothetical protein|tara:strand:+ start:249 stop:431 length:183 start_codon:yes stop_codon:yes gene_type:complete
MKKALLAVTLVIAKAKSRLNRRIVLRTWFYEKEEEENGLGIFCYDFCGFFNRWVFPVFLR